MKKHWLRRLLISYLPIFYVIVSALILIFFHVLGDLTQKQAVNANKVFVEQVIQVVDQSLRNIDLIMINEIETSAEINRFMAGSTDTDTYIDKYKAVEKIEKLKISNPLIDSLYLYRVKDHTVLSNSVMVPLENFADREFILNIINSGQTYRWTGVRNFSQFPVAGNTQRVVSLIRRIPVMAGNQGIMVANINVDRLQYMVKSMSDPQISFVNIFSADGEGFFKVDSQGRELSKIKSSYTGWEYHSGVNNSVGFNLVSMLTNVWVILGILLVFAGGVWMVVVSRRNYRPIESIMNRINALPGSKKWLQAETEKDEFTFIQWTLDGLMEQSREHEKQHEEDNEVKNRHFFRELLIGARRISQEEWKAKTASMGLSEEFDASVVIITRIDGYSSLAERFSEEELKDYKSVLVQTFREFSGAHTVSMYVQWDTQDQLCLLFQWSQENNITQKGLIGICENIRLWIGKNLPFTITIGMGSCVQAIEEIPQSYLEALESLEYRTAMGKNNVIVYWEVQSKPREEIYKYLGLVNLFAQAYKTGNEAWQSMYADMFEKIKGSAFKDDDITGFLRYIVYCVNQEMQTLGEDFRSLWEEQALGQLYMAMNDYESLEEVQQKVYHLLREVSSRLEVLRQSRSSHGMMEAIKKYIDENHTDPNLSRERLGEMFDIHVNSISKLFKDEFGDKFVDYLLKVRIEHARKLLGETGESVEQIGSMVGYTNSISFIRAFKKYTGITPGDYRKEIQP